MNATPGDLVRILNTKGWWRVNKTDDDAVTVWGPVTEQGASTGRMSTRTFYTERISKVKRPKPPA